jgi:hypothetical protein
MGDYQENLVNVSIILGMTLFIMSWDYVVPAIKSLRRKVFSNES